MSLITDTYHRISDTLLNFVTGLGTAKDPRSSTRFQYRELDRATLEQMYRSDWLARRIVDLPAEDATREWRQWIAARPQLEKIDLLEKKLELQKKARQALQRARLYGGAALVIGVNQGQPEEELDLDAVGLGDLKFVVVVNRYELAAGPRIFNVDSEWYTRPEYYTVATPMFGFYGEAGGAYPEGLTKPFVTPQWQQGQAPPQLNDPSRRTTPNYGMVRMHPSRVIEFTGAELPDWRLAPMGGGWGDSVLQTVDDSLRDFAMITSGLASLVNDMKMDVVRVPDLSRKLSTNDITQKTLERFGLANMAKSSINTLLLDKEEEWQRIQTSFGSTPELIKVAMTIACAAGGVPETRIMGNAPNKGLASQGSSGGEVDIRNYYDDIGSKQKSQYKPMLHPLDRCVQQSALGRYDPHIDYEWNPLYQPTAQEQANMALAKAQTTQVYVNCGLINEDALREAVVSQLTEDKIYPGLEDAIDEFGAEPEEPPQPLQPAPPTPPPGMMPKGAFDPNPFHMLRAQAAAKAGQPIRVPPNRPAGPQKFLPVPPGAQQKDAWLDDYDAKEERDEQGRWTAGAAEAVLRSGSHVTDIGQLSPHARSHLNKLVKQGHATKGEDYGYPIPKTRYEPASHFVAQDEWIEDDELEDFNPNHDPKTGRFTSGEALAAREARSQRAKEARGRAQAQAEGLRRSKAAKAAHAARRAREAEAFPVPPNATPHEVGVTAVSRVIAAHKGHATKGEVAAAAKQDVKTAVEAFTSTQHLKTPKVPEGMDPETVKTAYRFGVMTKRFFTDPESRRIIASAITHNTISWMRQAPAKLPGHAVALIHRTLVDKIADSATEVITDTILVGIGAAVTAATGPLGLGLAASTAGGMGTTAGLALHSEIEAGVEHVAKEIGFTPEHIKEALHGVAHALLGHYRKWREMARHTLIGSAPLFGQGPALDAEPEEGFDPIEEALKALADVLGEDEPEDGNLSSEG